MPTELLYIHDPYLQTAEAVVTAVHERGVEFDRTIFYPLGGGQPGDSGAVIRADGERLAIIDTRKGEPGHVVHLPTPGGPALTVGEHVQLVLDWPRRYALMRLHTALHVMSCVVKAPVTGGNIAPDRARLDFDIDMTLLNAESIERETNALIGRAIDTCTVWITDEELDVREAVHRFCDVRCRCNRLIQGGERSSYVDMSKFDNAVADDCSATVVAQRPLWDEAV